MAPLSDDVQARPPLFSETNPRSAIVVSPSLDDSRVADVIRFDARVLVKTFDELDTQRNGANTKNRKLNFPIFVALDPQPGDDGDSSNLIAKASWVESVPLPGAAASTSPDLAGGDAGLERATHSRNKGSHEGFVERVRREYAELNGVDVRKVFINIRYVEE